MRKPTGQRASILRRKTLNTFASLMHLKGKINESRYISPFFNEHCNQPDIIVALEKLDQACADIMEALTNQKVMKNDALEEIHQISCDVAARCNLRHSKDLLLWNEH